MMINVLQPRVLTEYASDTLEGFELWDYIAGLLDTEAKYCHLTVDRIFRLKYGTPYSIITTSDETEEDIYFRQLEYIEQLCRQKGLWVLIADKSA